MAVSGHEPPIVKACLQVGDAFGFARYPHMSGFTHLSHLLANMDFTACQSFEYRIC